MKKINKDTINYLSKALLMLLIILIICLACRLNIYALIAVCAIGIILIPIILNTSIRQSINYSYFTQLCDYLTNIIPIFLQKTKIRFTLGELYEICDGEMKKCILEAINYIDNTKDDPNLLADGLKIIEKRFPNSRVYSVHKFLLNVENTNSVTYKEIAESLFDDVEKWIKRTYQFQKDLKNRRTKILLLSISTLLLNVLFVFIYVSNEYFVDFVNNIYYQISSSIFIVLMLIIIVIVMTKLNGEWLINDAVNTNNEELKETYRKYKKGKQKIKPLDIVIMLLILLAGAYFVYTDKALAGFAFLAIAIIFISQKPRHYYKIKNTISKNIMIEFPMWLREVSLSLNNLTVLNAIDNSLNTVSYPFRRELRNFLSAANNNPTSIKPYNDFLDEYQIDDVKPSMRVLYAINNISTDEMKKRTSKLIIRNQELLEKAESIRNNDSIGAIEMIGYIPTIIFSLQMMSSMIIMFNFMLEKLGGQV